MANASKVSPYTQTVVLATSTAEQVLIGFAASPAPGAIGYNSGKSSFLAVIMAAESALIRRGNSAYTYGLYI